MGVLPRSKLRGDQPLLLLILMGSFLANSEGPVPLSQILTLLSSGISNVLATMRLCRLECRQCRWVMPAVVVEGGFLALFEK
jgi:hypothetical protein